MLTPSRHEYRPNGDLDRSFGTRGRAITSFGTYAWLSSVAIDAEDRIVAAGSHCEDGTCSFLLARYKRNGRLDPSFGSGGSVTMQFGASYSWLGSVAIDPQGRIVAAGWSSGAGFALARYLPNGDLDPSFGTGGKVTTSGGSATSVAIDPQGRIVAAGYTRHFALARYRSNGDLDPSFGRDGMVTTRFQGHNSTADAAAIDSRNRIVLTGHAGSDLALARYRPNGDLDRSFGGGGKVTIKFGRDSAGADAVAIDPRDRIIAAGGDTNFRLARFIGYRSRR